MKKIKNKDILEMKVGDKRIFITVHENSLTIQTEENCLIGVSPVTRECIDVVFITNEKRRVYDA